MSPIDDSTGSPPAITFERLEQWRELSAAIESALNMGGEPGMDLLVSRVAEWNEAVDEWTTGLQTCLDLGYRGLRDEALQWHADGFFGAGDGLHAPTRREGWDAWHTALEEKEIPLPRFDLELQEKVQSFGDELVAFDISGRSLREQIDALRRNALVRGDMGDRLTLLNSIRSLDEGREIWNTMIAPIRRTRAEGIEAEVRAALAARDFTKMARQVEEVQSVDWEGQIPGRVVSLTSAISHLISSRDEIHGLEESAALLGTQAAALKDQPLNLPSFPTLLQAALQARQTYLSVRQRLGDSLQQAASLPETKAVVNALKLIEKAKQIDASAKPALTAVGHQQQFEKLRRRFGEKEDEIHNHIAIAPALDGNWDEYKRKSARWLDLETKLRIQTDRLCKNSPDFVPPSTIECLTKLESQRNAVKSQRDRVVKNEKIVIVAVIGGFVLILVLLVIVLAVSASPRSTVSHRP